MKSMALTQEYQLVVLQPGRLDLQGGTALEKHLVTLIPQPHDLCVIDLTQVDLWIVQG